MREKQMTKTVRGGRPRDSKEPSSRAVLMLGVRSAQDTISGQDFPALHWISHSSRLTGAILFNFDNKVTGDGLMLISPCSLPSSGSLESAHTLHT